MSQTKRKGASSSIPPEMISRAVERLRALADEARIRILLRLLQGECNVTTLVEELAIAQASVSKHLSILRRTGVLKVRREGAQAFYSIKDPSAFDILKIVCDAVCRDQAELVAAIGVKAPNFEI